MHIVVNDDPKTKRAIGILFSAETFEEERIIKALEKVVEIGATVIVDTPDSIFTFQLGKKPSNEPTS